MEYKLQPWGHQLEAIEKAKSLPWYAFLFSPGAGKTLTAINTLRHKMMERRAYLRTVVLCPPVVVPQWKEEFLKNSKLDPKQIVLLIGSSKKRLQLFEENKNLPGVVFVTNYESLTVGGRHVEVPGRKTKRYEPGPLFLAFEAWSPQALIFDESHRLKSGEAIRSKLADRLANPKGSFIRDPYGGVIVDPTMRPLVYLLTGSPVLNSQLDIFQQYKILNGGSTFGDNFFTFRARYFVDKNAGMNSQRHFPDWQILPGAEEEINRRIYQCAMRVTKEECMDLPDQVSVKIPCELTPEQAKNYRELKNQLVTAVDQGIVTTDMALTKSLRLMQITSGFLPMDNEPGQEGDRAKHVYKDTPKVEALEELLADLTPTSKVLVWAVWKENYATIRAICEKLEVEHVEVHGGISPRAQAANVEAFKLDAKKRVFLGHPGSGGIGINLVVAPYSIFYSRTFSLEHYLQARARNHRGGQTLKVTHYDLICGQTIEEAAQEKLAYKYNLGERLLTTDDHKQIFNKLREQKI